MLKFRTFLRMILKILSDGVIRIITIISRPNEHARNFNRVCTYAYESNKQTN